MLYLEKYRNVHIEMRKYTEGPVKNMNLMSNRSMDDGDTRTKKLLSISEILLVLGNRLYIEILLKTVRCIFTISFSG